MKKIITLFAAVAAWVCVSAATTFTFDSSDDLEQTIDGITVTLSKGTGTNDPAYYSNGMRLYANNTITVSGTDLTKVSMSFAKQGQKDYASLSASAGSLAGGGESTSATDKKTDVWTGSANSVVFTLGSKGQRLIFQLVVNGDAASTNPGTDPDVPVTDLDPEYEYDEPTVVSYEGKSPVQGAAYSFVENNVQVSCTKGAVVDTAYFSAHAGFDITFTATQPIQALAVNGYVKKGFSATASAGEIDYLSSGEEDLEGGPVLVINNINATSVTINCVKQLRCYDVELYFEEGSDLEVDGDIDYGELDYSYEPEEVTTLNVVLDTAVYMVVMNDPSYEVGIVDVYLEGEEQYIELYAYVSSSSINAGDYLPAGTYTIDATGNAGTIAASPGGDAEMDYPSYVATDFSLLGYGAAYYLMSGTVTVAKNGGVYTIAINALSYYGSSITASYTGTLEEYEEEIEDALEDAVANKAAVKMIEDGKVVIIRNGERYNATGLRLN